MEEPQPAGETVAPPSETVTPPSETVAPPSASDPPRCFGPYQVIREVARGGMGVVYEARHPELERRVAVKVLLAGGYAGEVELERFAIEARATARLKHPNIVAIHDVGEQDGHPFLVMDFVQGRSLKERLGDGPLEPREAAQLVERIARALAYAHAQGVLHRDIKPANVLLEADQPLLMDFGLAKEIGEDSDGPTRSGQAMGTPAYMPPEQANGDLERIDRRSDVYALGATLFTCLTGRAPFGGNNVMSIISQVLSRPAPSPRALRPEVDRDLETLCLKCLEKEPESRYDSASALADDLGRYLRHEPLVARRPSLLQAGVKWARRNRGVAWTLLGSSLVLLGAAAVSGALWIQRTQDHVEALRVETNTAQTERDKAQALEREAKLQEGRAQDEAEQAKLERVVATINLAEARLGEAWTRRSRAELLRSVAAVLSLVQASGESRPGPSEELASADRRRVLIRKSIEPLVLEQVRQELGRVRTQGFLRPRAMSKDLVRTFAVAPSGDEVAVVCGEVVALWSLESGAPLLVLEALEPLTSCGFDPRGELVAAAASSGRVFVFDRASGRLVRTLDSGQDGGQVDLTFTASGDTLCAIDWETPTGSFWRREDWRAVKRTLGGRWGWARDPTTQQAIATRLVRGEPIERLSSRPKDLIHRAISADGREVADLIPNGIRVWSAKTSQTILDRPLELEASSVAFSPRGDHLLLRSPDACALLRRSDGRVLHTFSTGDGEGLVFAPGHDRLIGQRRDGGLVAWSWAGRRLLAHPPIPDLVGVRAIQPAGRLFAAAEWEGIVVRDFETQKRLIQLPHPEAQDLVFSRDGKQLLSRSVKTVRVWDLATGSATTRLTPPPTVRGAHFGTVALGHAVALVELRARGRRSALLLVDTTTGKHQGALVDPESSDSTPTTCAAFDPTGKIILTGSKKGQVRLWGVKQGHPVLRRWYAGAIEGCTIGPQGNAVVGLRDEVHVLSREGRPRLRLKAGTGRPLLLEYSPTGDRLLTVYPDRVALWDRQGRLIAERPASSGHWTVSWSAGLLVSYTPEGVTTWKLPDTTPRLLGRHHKGVSDVAWSADARRVVSAGGGEVRIWDAVGWRELHALKQPGSFRCGLAAGRVAAAGSGQLAVWDAVSGDLLRETTWERSLSSTGGGCALGKDGARVLGGAPLRLWDVETGNVLRTFPQVTAHLACAIEGDQALITTIDGELRLQDLITGQAGPALEGHATAVIDCGFSPDGDWVASCGHDGVNLSDRRSGELLRSLRPSIQGKYGGPSALSWGRSGLLAVGVRDGSRGRVELRDPLTGFLLRSIELAHPPSSCAFDPEGRRILVGTRSGDVRIIDLGIAPSLEELFGDLSRPSDLLRALRLPFSRLRLHGSVDPIALTRFPRLEPAPG